MGIHLILWIFLILPQPFLLLMLPSFLHKHWPLLPTLSLSFPLPPFIMNPASPYLDNTTILLLHFTFPYPNTPTYLSSTTPVPTGPPLLQSIALCVPTIKIPPAPQHSIPPLPTPTHIQALLQPLRAMCTSQLQHGSVTHHSKQYLIENGLFCKALPKSRRRKRAMRRNCGVDV